jgi:hypothetical protein
VIYWQWVVEKEGKIVHEREGNMIYSALPDPFAHLSQMVAAEEAESAGVSVTVQRSLQYGEVKCSFTLAIAVPQKKEFMDYAARELFAQAVQYVNDGMSWIAPGTEPLQVPTPR